MPCQPAMPSQKMLPATQADLTLENLFRMLLNHLADIESRNAPSANARGSENQAEEQIVCDTVLDGAHYLLIRLNRPAHPPVQLSPREQEIVRMVAQGHPNKIIADVLNISCWTVSTHLRRIFAKLGVGSRAAMVARLMDPPRNVSIRSRSSAGLEEKVSFRK